MHKIDYKSWLRAGAIAAATATIAAVIAVSPAGATVGKTETEGWGLINGAKDSTAQMV
ncbi:hypothetical protein [Kutzneria sp. CA-103260]|uniref:hypothetical protein n=1 Tax=Kutzneria sp. CA-103260 TaxID=2802641 RepID=UPI001BA756B7|nr:hypothetical protein [Kutzneria sp. CA-103260]